MNTVTAGPDGMPGTDTAPKAASVVLVKPAITLSLGSPSYHDLVRECLGVESKFGIAMKPRSIGCSTEAMKEILSLGKPCKRCDGRGWIQTSNPYDMTMLTSGDYPIGCVTKSCPDCTRDFPLPPDGDPR